MLGSIFGDIVGSAYEFNPTNNYNFKLLTQNSTFTDDTICTIAVADAFMNHKPYADALREWCLRHHEPIRSFGGSFDIWLQSDSPNAYFSWGNGSAMRVSALGWLCNSQNEVITQATYSAACTHNHPDGIRGAQAVALATFLAVQGASKDDILACMENAFGYFIKDGSLEAYRGIFDESCRGTVPAAFLCIRDSESYEDAIRLAVSLGADADTLGAIVGSIAEPLYGMPDKCKKDAIKRLPQDMVEIVTQFNNLRYGY